MMMVVGAVFGVGILVRVMVAHMVGAAAFGAATQFICGSAMGLAVLGMGLLLIGCLLG
ncbi:MAG: hypothetical protein LBS68_02060 [Puniceicoccales bacterium]|nr:hypothetical protein [Puniceicoccales bacterium]